MRPHAFIDTRSAASTADLLGPEDLQLGHLADGSFARATLRHMTRLHDTPAAASRLMSDGQTLHLLANTALPGAEYLLVVRQDRSIVIVAGAPEAPELLEEALTPQTVDGEIYHVRVHQSKVTVTGINDVRAACIAGIDWNLELETVRHSSAPDRPLHVVRRAGHPIATGVIARRSGTESAVTSRLTGQLSIPEGLAALDRLRVWHLITTAAIDDVGRPVLATDNVTVNEMPSARWLADLTCCADARLAQWISSTAT